ncbi:MAG: hypothetical protein HYY23_17205 [Verrucomicrobia bacterium]|nr:hypothetical protein [Verrucomicrobiota bacterium]
MSNAPEYAVGWGTLALLNAGLAQSKNRSGLNWFLISLLLGPMATFLLVALCEKLPREVKHFRPKTTLHRHDCITNRHGATPRPVNSL